jgi:hypothetical protein
MTGRQPGSRLIAAFAWLMRAPGGRHDGQLLFVFLVVNGLVLFNVILHDPIVQYDGGRHLKYVATLSELRLPTPQDSHEFFSPPLPYFVPAALHRAGLSLWWAAKIGQMLNFALSLGITSMLIALCRWAKPTDGKMALIALTCLGALPVYYKTMSFVRGEPYVAFLTLVGIAVTARAITSDRSSLSDAILPGGCWGLLALARQWGGLAATAMLLAICAMGLRDRDRNKITVGVAGLVVALAVGGWFYAWLWVSQGSPFAFNKHGGHWALANQPAEFYFGTGNGLLFTDPIRPSFANQLIPIFYADTWGDYWGYFLISGRDLVSGDLVVGNRLEHEAAKLPLTVETNRFTFNNYLGRVNLVGLLPTILALAAFGAVAIKLSAILRRGPPLTLAEVIPMLAVLVVGVSVIGYLWFLIRFPVLNEGDTIKASYMLHIFPPLALLTADFVRRMRVPVVPWLIAWGMLMIHNIPAVTTHVTDLHFGNKGSIPREATSYRSDEP